MGAAELARPVAVRAEALDERAVGPRTWRCGPRRPARPGPGTASLCASATKMLPSAAMATSFGSVNACGGRPAVPGVPSVSRSLPCGLNFSTAWPLPAASGNFFNSSGVAERASTIQTLPCRSTSMPCGHMSSPAPKLATTVPAASSFTIGSTVGTGARVAAAAVARPDVRAVDVHGDRTHRTPRPAVGQRAEVPHRLVGIGQVVDRGDGGVLGRGGGAALSQQRAGRQQQRGTEGSGGTGACHRVSTPVSQTGLSDIASRGAARRSSLRRLGTAAAKGRPPPGGASGGTGGSSPASRHAPMLPGPSARHRQVQHDHDHVIVAAASRDGTVLPEVAEIGGHYW